MKKSFILLTLLVGTLAFTSCKKENPTPEPPKQPELTDVCGKYAGYMAVVAVNPLSSAPAGDPFQAEINDDSLRFAKFPVENLIKSIVGEEGAGAIIEALGDVAYNVGYAPAFNAAKDSILLTFTPKPLELVIPDMLGEGVDGLINVEIAALDKGGYSLKEKKAGYTLVAQSVEMNGAVLPLPQFPIRLGFQMSKVVNE